LAKSASRKKTQPPPPPPWRIAWEQVREHPILARVAYRVRPVPGGVLQTGRWTEVGADGNIRLDNKRRGSVDDWRYVLAHALLHVGYGHHLIPPDADPLAWNLAADVQIQGMLRQLLGEQDRRWIPAGYHLPQDTPRRLLMADHKQLSGLPALARYQEMGGGDLVATGKRRLGGLRTREMSQADWQRLLAEGMREHAADAIDQVSAAGWHDQGPRSQARLTLAWFMANFPLLSSLAAGFKLIESEQECRRLDIAVAAVNTAKRIIYINPRAGLDEEELRFVIAHEVLHVAMLHAQRRQGRDPLIWNLATDHKINQWLLEIRVGHAPDIGMVLMPEYNDLSAEEIYQRLAADVRRARKLITLRGKLGDILDMGDSAGGLDPTVEDWVRHALRNGLELHHQRGRGDLPAGMREEIEMIAADPVPWDAQLAEWFDAMFPPLVPQRSFARASRRQSSTPDIVRPGRRDNPGEKPSRVFSVLLDTSASMAADDLSRAIGAIVSYGVAHDVQAVRLIDCDARPYDRGYLEVEALTGRVEVHGRGGTTLQPGLDLLDTLDDLPRDAPVMIITDGAYEQELKTAREHCYVMAPGTYPWWRTHGPVFVLD